jgi:rhodanese-related sulfurtransferase
MSASSALKGIQDLFWWVPLGWVPEISAEALSQALARAASAPQILDVRTEGEWQRGHIEGAIHVPVQHLKVRLPTLGLDRGRPVVAVCLSAHRSIPAVRLLRRQGFTDAKQLAGGMLAWRRAGLPESQPESQSS